MNDKRKKMAASAASGGFERSNRRSVVESKPGAAIQVKSYALTESEEKDLSISFHLPSANPAAEKSSD